VAVNAEVIAIGTELLLGEIVDTNSVHIARQLRTIGLDLHYMTTVGDNLERIARVVATALDRVDVVITTGGLGPTVDDVTREAVAKATGHPLVIDPDLLAQIEAFFARLGRPMKENNRRQAYIPKGATPIPNPVGSAPAFIVETGQGVVVTLPGVPREMKYLLETAVLPYLRDRFHLNAVIKSKILRTVAAGESNIDAQIADLMELANPTVGLAAHPGQTDVRITAKAETEAAADRLIAPVEAEIRRRLGDIVYGEGNEAIEAVVAQLLRRCHWRVAFFSSGPDCRLLPRLEAEGIPVERVEGHAPSPVEEEQEALSWARAVRETSGADVGVVVAAASDDDREFTIVAVSSPAGERSVRLAYWAIPEYRKQWVANVALDLLRRLAMRHLAQTGVQA